MRTLLYFYNLERHNDQPGGITCILTFPPTRSRRIR